MLTSYRTDSDASGKTWGEIKVILLEIGGKSARIFLGPLVSGVSS